MRAPARSTPPLVLHPPWCEVAKCNIEHPGGYHRSAELVVADSDGVVRACVFLLQYGSGRIAWSMKPGQFAQDIPLDVAALVVDAIRKVAAMAERG